MNIPQESVPEPKLQVILRERDLLKYTGLRRSQLRAMMTLDEFPKPFKLSSTGRATGWFEEDIISWQQKRQAVRVGPVLKPAAKAEKVSRLSR